MDDRLLDRIAEPFNANLPEYKTMEQMLNEILPAVKPFSEPSLTSSEKLLNVEWVKMTDKPGETQLILYRYRASGEIRISVDGDMDSLSYTILEDNPKRVVIGQNMYRDSKLYNLAFLDNDFLILKRHGNQDNISAKDRYLMFCSEPIGTRLTWDEALEKLVVKYRNNAMPWGWIMLVLGVILALVFYLA